MKQREYHGGRETKLYDVWTSMRQRCENPRNKRFSRYGGRGIRVCYEWDSSFRAFREWAYTHGYAEGLSIERVDNDGDYSPENCIWADRVTQSNNRCTNHWVIVNGEAMTMQQAAARYGIPYGTFRGRLQRGWSADKAATEKRRAYHEKIPAA